VWRRLPRSIQPAYAARPPSRSRSPLLVLHFDYVVAPAALAVLRLQRLADAGADVRFSGLDVLGLEVAVPVTLDQLTSLDAARGPAAELGLTLGRPSLRPPTLPAHLVGELADAHGVGASWRLRCLRAYWEQGADLGDEDVLLELAVESGLQAPVTAAALRDRDLRTTLRRRMVRDRSRGIGGVPVLETSGGALVPADLSDGDLRQLAALG
jgi:2-hydroxychromene-2-carboxylate isomerase